MALERTTLVVGNKRYSSWSMRPWILMRQLGIPFEEVQVRLDLPGSRDEARRQGSPTGLVPVLRSHGMVVWESTAILEAVAELWPERGVWPADVQARAHARSVVAEMHAGFRALRAACPVNFGKRFPRRDRGPDVAADVARIEAMWRECRARFGAGGPFLFGGFCAADAMYAPVVNRFWAYSIDVAPDTAAYMEAVQALPAYQEWSEAGRREAWVIAEDEVDEEPLTVFC